MACGKAVIVSNNTGCVEIIRDGVNGFLFSPYNPDQLAVRIRELIENPVQRKEMGAAARQSMKEKCELTNVISEWESWLDFFFNNLSTRNAGHGPCLVS